MTGQTWRFKINKIPWHAIVPCCWQNYFSIKTRKFSCVIARGVSPAAYSDSCQWLVLCWSWQCVCVGRGGGSPVLLLAGGREGDTSVSAPDWGTHSPIKDLGPEAVEGTWDQRSPPPVDRQKDRCLLKHYLPVVAHVGGNYPVFEMETSLSSVALIA